MRLWIVSAEQEIVYQNFSCFSDQAAINSALDITIELSLVTCPYTLHNRICTNSTSTSKPYNKPSLKTPAESWWNHRFSQYLNEPVVWTNSSSLIWANWECENTACLELEWFARVQLCTSYQNRLGRLRVASIFDSVFLRAISNLSRKIFRLRLWCITSKCHVLHSGAVAFPKLCSSSLKYSRERITLINSKLWCKNERIILLQKASATPLCRHTKANPVDK